MGRITGTADGDATWSANTDYKAIDKQIPVADWWEQVVYVSGNRIKASRRDLVLAAADKDGGAHVDKKHRRITTDDHVLLCFAAQMDSQTSE